MRHQERGMSMWPFVITLLLLLAFVFLWYGQRDEADKLKATVADLKLQISNESPANPGLKEQIADLEGRLLGYSEVIGYRTENYRNQVISDVAALKKALSMETGSPLADLKAASTVPVKRDYFKPKGAASAQELDLKAKIPQVFKDKLRELNDKFPGNLPAMPEDPDDQTAWAEYGAKRQEWSAKFDEWNKLLTQLVEMRLKVPGEGGTETEIQPWGLYKSVIGTGVAFDPDKSEVVNVPFWERPPTSMMTVEEALKVPPVIVKSIVATMKERVEALQKDVDALAKDKEQLRLVTDNADPAALGLKQQLEAVQAKLAADTQTLQTEAERYRGDLEKIRVELTSAQQELAAVKEKAVQDVAKLERDKSALDNRIRTDKEIRDLAIQRDDPDGVLLAADNAMMIGYINLGTADKVYAGLSFRVSYMGRGGIRSPKGDVVVMKVLDAHYSQVAIARVVDGERPMGAGDMISNPFFEAGKTIHVFLAGELRKYPRSIAVARLQKMGCVVQDAVNADTDWIVLPDSIAVAPQAASSEEDTSAAPEESPYDKLQRLARTFGATLVTESLIESFLGY